MMVRVMMKIKVDAVLMMNKESGYVKLHYPTGKEQKNGT